MHRTHEGWERLLVLLGEMREIFQEFMTLLRDEERRLLEMDRQGVADVTEKKEQVLDTMRRYEQQVIAVLHQLAGQDKHERLEVWLKQARHPHASTARTKLHDLADLTKQIQVHGKKNEALIRRTHHVVREAINLIYAGLGTGPVYQGSGALYFPTVLSSVHLHG
ncbi:MAG: flagellar protein FlgN [Nitrospirota bacterium]|nr:flagellar protein FlgN [Nitrospirota bacterium]